MPEGLTRLDCDLHSFHLVLGPGTSSGQIRVAERCSKPCGISASPEGGYSPRLAQAPPKKYFGQAMARWRHFRTPRRQSDPSDESVWSDPGEAPRPIGQGPWGRQPPAPPPLRWEAFQAPRGAALPPAAPSEDGAAVVLPGPWVGTTPRRQSRGRLLKNLGGTEPPAAWGSRDFFGGPWTGAWGAHLWMSEEQRDSFPSAPPDRIPGSCQRRGHDHSPTEG